MTDTANLATVADVSRDKQLNLRVTEAELAAWTAAADAAGLKLAEWCRRRITGTVTVTIAEPPPPSAPVAKPAPKRRTRNSMVLKRRP